MYGKFVILRNITRVTHVGKIKMLQCWTVCIITNMRNLGLLSRCSTESEKLAFEVKDRSARQLQLTYKTLNFEGSSSRVMPFSKANY